MSSQHHQNIDERHTFITTLKPLSFNILAANSECLHASLLYLENAANIADAGGRAMNNINQ